MKNNSFNFIKVLAGLILALILALSLAANIPGPLSTAWWADEGDSFGVIIDETNILDLIVAHWKMEEFTGNPRFDSVGTNTLFDFSVVARILDGGKFNNAAFASDSPAFLGSTNMANFNLDGHTCSINFWLKHDNQTPGNFIMGVWDTASIGLQQWVVRVNSSSNILWIVGNGSTYVTNKTTATINTTNAFVMVTVTYDVDTDVSKVYINAGAPSISDAPQVVEIGDFDDNKFTIFNENGGAESYYGGIIDSVSFWRDRILTAAEISTLYNGGAGLDYPFN